MSFFESFGSSFAFARDSVLFVVKLRGSLAGRLFDRTLILMGAIIIMKEGLRDGA